MEQQAPSKDSMLVAAIDFGTTYSGYAFSLKDNPEKVHVQQHLNQNEKTATCILIDQDKKFMAFGFEAEDRYNQLVEDSEDDDNDDRSYEKYYFFRQFKMALYKRSGIMTRATLIEDETGKKLPAMLVISLSIKYMKDHLLTLINKSYIGVEEDDIHWVITIPAIWDDSAKQFMREAAVNGGIQSEHLSLALEPEVASLYCHSVKVILSEEGTPADAGAKKKIFRSSRAGTKCMILDLGGGTADITVHECQVDGGLREIHEPSGGPWGGTAVDRNFFKFLTDVFGKKSVESFKRNNMADFLDLCREFEKKKRNIKETATQKVTIKLPVSFSKAFEENSNISFDIAISKSEYAGKVEGLLDKLKIDADIAKDLFAEPIQQIVSHVDRLLKKIGKIQMILMVGGFSDCDLVDRAIRRNFPDIDILNPAEGSLAVLRGAVIFGFKPMAIVSRVAKYTYGYEAWPRFNPKVHPQERKVSLDGVDCCKGVFKPYIRLGAEINSRDYIESKHCPVSNKQKDIAIGIYTSESENPKYITDSDVRHIGTLKLPLPVFKPGQRRIVCGRLRFGATEVIVEAKEMETGIIQKGTFDCL